MNVRCKVRLTSVIKQTMSSWNGATKKHEPVDYHNAVFSFVTAGDGDGQSEENKRFWDATPSGRLEIGTTKEMPWEVGKEYYLDVVPAT